MKKIFGVLSVIGIATVAIPSLWGQGYTITTVAGGGGQAGYLASPAAVAVDAAGNLYIADKDGAVIRKVSPAGVISTVAGNPSLGSGFNGDGGPATSAPLSDPYGVAVDAAGNLYIADTLHSRIRKVDASGTITTVAGGGATLYLVGQSGPATSAMLNYPVGVTVDVAGNIFIAESGRVRKVALDGTISTVAGTGFLGGFADGVPATSTSVDPTAVAVDAAGNLYIADGDRIRKVSTSGIISTIAGNGAETYSGDGGPATNAALNLPRGVAVDFLGNVYVADSGNCRVRMVSTGGMIETIAGNGFCGFAGDGGPAASARFATYLSGLAVDNQGRVFIADWGNGRVRMLTPSASASAPSISSNGVVSASAFGKSSSIAPGSFIEIYGANLATDSRGWTGADFTGNNAPTSLDGTKVTIGGQSAFVNYISPTQVNVQVPSNVSTGQQPVIVTTGAGASAAYTATVNATQPGLLAPSSFSINGKQYIAAFFQDGATLAMPPGMVAGVPSQRAKPADILTLYGIGFGTVTPNIAAGQLVQQTNQLTNSLHISIGGTDSTVLYDGLAPGMVGVYQFNVAVPNIAANDTAPLTFTLGGAAGTQTLYIAVQN